MKSKKFHIIYIPFRGVGIDLRDAEWYERRVEIFKDYTLPSLKSQTDKDFVLWLSFRPEDQWNATTWKLKREIEQAGLKSIFTFDGLMYWDDKASRNPIQVAKNIARVFRFCYRNGVWKQLMPHLLQMWQLLGKNKTLGRRLTASLGKLEKKYGVSDCAQVLLTRIDSDDMFLPKACAIIKEVAAKRNGLYAITIPRGYIFNSKTGQYAEWNPITNPPFHTIVFPAFAFVIPGLHRRAYGKYRSHEDVPDVFKTEELHERLFCVVTHVVGDHISTIWDHPYRGSFVDRI